MSSTPLVEPDADRVEDLLRAWSKDALQAGTVVALESTGQLDDRGQFRWLIRLAGEEKEFITLWLTLRQRTIHVEVQLMPAPEENIEEVFRFLLAKNADLYGLHLALGPESAIYLVGRVPVGELTAERVDELCGAALQYVDEIFPTAMSMGLSSMYRRRRRNS